MGEGLGQCHVPLVIDDTSAGSSGSRNPPPLSNEYIAQRAAQLAEANPDNPVAAAIAAAAEDAAIALASGRRATRFRSQSPDGSTGSRAHTPNSRGSSATGNRSVTPGSGNTGAVPFSMEAMMMMGMGDFGMLPAQDQVPFGMRSNAELINNNVMAQPIIPFSQILDSGPPPLPSASSLPFQTPVLPDAARPTIEQLTAAAVQFSQLPTTAKSPKAGAQSSSPPSDVSAVTTSSTSALPPLLLLLLHRLN